MSMRAKGFFFFGGGGAVEGYIANSMHSLLLYLKASSVRTQGFGWLGPLSCSSKLHAGNSVLFCLLTYLWLVGNGGMGYDYNYYYYHSSIPY